MTHEAGRGHATPHMPVETAKCWWLLKIILSLKPAQTPSKMSQKPLAKLLTHQRTRELLQLEGQCRLHSCLCYPFGSIFSNHLHFAVSTGICGVACPLPASRVDKPLIVNRATVCATVTAMASSANVVYPGFFPGVYSRGEMVESNPPPPPFLRCSGEWVGRRGGRVDTYSPDHP